MARRKLTKEEKETAFQKLCEEEFHRTRGEEWANGITHLLGIVFAITALTLMAVYSSLRGTVWHIVSCSIYGATLVFLTFSSTLYHLLTNFRAKRVFQILDHCTIYFLIAGSYTPFVFVTMNHSPIAWTIFGIEWGLLLCGVFIETVFPQIVKYASLPIYLVMGWLILINLKTVWGNLPPAGLFWLVTGGVAYTAGVGFYVMDRTPYMHTIWHVFVLAGVVCHWICVMFHVIPA